jgi:hypothetical protein
VTSDSARYDEGVAMAEVLAAANASPVSEIGIILDCCNSGEMGAVPAINNLNANIREGVTILTASRPKEAALEDTTGGVFTGLVLGALEGGAADLMGAVTMAGIYGYVDEALGAWDQRPLYKAHVARFEPIRRCREGVDRAVLLRLVELFDSADHEIALDTSYEPTEDPRNAEHERDFADLQKLRAAKLVEPVGEDHMYYAALRGKSCRMTPLGRRYWRLADAGRL